MAKKRFIWLIVAVPAMAAGCAVGWRVGGGPLADTGGNVGLLAGGGMVFGFKINSEQGLVETLDAGVGSSLASKAGFLTGALGFDWLHQELLGRNLGLRAGIRGRYLGRFSEDGLELHTGGAGAAVAFLFVLDQSYDPGHEKMGGGGKGWSNLALELQGFYTATSHEGGAGGLFLLVLSYEINSIVNMF